MIAETSKELGSQETAIKFYLKGISGEPMFLDNLIDFSQICYLKNEPNLANVILMFAKILQKDTDESELDDFTASPDIKKAVQKELDIINARRDDID